MHCRIGHFRSLSTCSTLYKFICVLVCVDTGHRCKRNEHITLKAASFSRIRIQWTATKLPSSCLNHFLCAFKILTIVGVLWAGSSLQSQANLALRHWSGISSNSLTSIDGVSNFFNSTESKESSKLKLSATPEAETGSQLSKSTWFSWESSRSCWGEVEDEEKGV